MTLLHWMRREGVRETTIASKLDCTVHAVRKWMYGERTPPAKRIVLIEKMTDGAVTLRDFVGGAA